jgi:hypothetical protein
MNERIQELMEEAGIYDFVVESMGINEEMEKFAELIVKECLTAIDKTDTTHIYTSFDQSMVMGTIEKSKKAVKEHFGVKE